MAVEKGSKPSIDVTKQHLAGEPVDIPEGYMLQSYFATVGEPTAYIVDGQRIGRITSAHAGRRIHSDYQVEQRFRLVPIASTQS